MTWKDFVLEVEKTGVVDTDIVWFINFRPDNGAVTTISNDSLGLYITNASVAEAAEALALTLAVEAPEAATVESIEVPVTRTKR